MNKKLSKEDALQELIDLGIIKEESDLRKSDKNGDMPLHTAVRHNSKEVVELILAVDPSLVAKENIHQHTPISTAIIHGKRELVSLMLKAYPRIIQDENGNPWCDSRGKNLLHYFTRYSETKDPNFLYVFCASPKAALFMRDFESNTPTHVAARWGQNYFLAHYAKKAPETLDMYGYKNLLPWELADHFGMTETAKFAQYCKRKYSSKTK